MSNHCTATSSQLDDLRRQLFADRKKALSTLDELAAYGDHALEVLMEFLQQRRGESPDPSLGKAYQMLWAADKPEVQNFLDTHFPTGVVPLVSDRGVDYLPLQRQLAAGNYQAADRLTLLKLCELAGPDTAKRQWLYFTEVENFPIPDLLTVDRLWTVHSEGKFGFSVQRKLWVSVGRDFNKLWTKINWKSGNIWTRYPNEFTWNLDAPVGHLPLSNQLRGVRAFASLLSHPAWDNINS